MGELRQFFQKFGRLPSQIGVQLRAIVFAFDFGDIEFVAERVKIYDRLTEIREGLNESMCNRRASPEVHHDAGHGETRSVQDPRRQQELICCPGKSQTGLGKQIRAAKQQFRRWLNRQTILPVVPG